MAHGDWEICYKGVTYAPLGKGHSFRCEISLFFTLLSYKVIRKEKQKQLNGINKAMYSCLFNTSWGKHKLISWKSWIRYSTATKLKFSSADANWNLRWELLHGVVWFMPELQSALNDICTDACASSTHVLMSTPHWHTYYNQLFLFVTWKYLTRFAGSPIISPFI